MVSPLPLLEDVLPAIDPHRLGDAQNLLPVGIAQPLEERDLAEARADLLLGQRVGTAVSDYGAVRVIHGVGSFSTGSGVGAS